VTDEPLEYEPDEPRRKTEEELRRAWGSWRQDRVANRRKVLRSLVWLVVIVVLTSLLAYGCDLLRGPPQVRLNAAVAGLTLQPPTGETERLRGQFEAAGAVGPAAGHYRGAETDILLVAGIGKELPSGVLSELLPPVTGSDLEYEGRGGALNCGATAEGSRCVWKNGEIVGGTAASRLAPDVLERFTRDLRAGALRP
jgi:hypothetical protein